MADLALTVLCFKETISYKPLCSVSLWEENLALTLLCFKEQLANKPLCSVFHGNLALPCFVLWGSISFINPFFKFYFTNISH
jgi:hypothetical protein